MVFTSFPKVRPHKQLRISRSEIYNIRKVRLQNNKFLSFRRQGKIECKDGPARIMAIFNLRTKGTFTDPAGTDIILFRYKPAP